MNIRDYIFSFIMKLLIAVELVLIIWAAMSFYKKKENKKLLNPTEFTYKGHDMVKFNSNVVHSPECRKCFPRYD